MEVCVVDYGGGNVRSLCNALEFLGAEYILSDDAEYVRNSGVLMLPGVGSFGAVMNGLVKKGLDSAVVDAIGAGARFFGICVGMQVLFFGSDESPGVPGLSVIDGDVVRFNRGKVPQIGWNTIRTLNEGVFLDGYVYFVNSYYCVPRDMGVAACLTEYGGLNFCSALRRGNVYATQFHPEKSGWLGLEIIRRWLYDR
ncbi:MAG: imidazole glycerol phosphate synthase subunit HisH [archaeon]